MALRQGVSFGNKDERTLSYWCMSGGVCMEVRGSFSLSLFIVALLFFFLFLNLCHSDVLCLHGVPFSLFIINTSVSSCFGREMPFSL